MKRFPYLVLAILVIVAVGGVLYANLPTPSVAQAQDAATADATMSGLFQRLGARMDGGGDFSINVFFIQPPIPGEPAWQIPGVLTDGSASRQLGEIGDSYVCFIERGLTFNDSICIPYSNIRMVTFPN